MIAHQIIDDLSRHGSRFFKSDFVVKYIISSQKFEIGEAYKINEIVSPGIKIFSSDDPLYSDFWFNRHFIPPYENCYFELDTSMGKVSFLTGYSSTENKIKILTLGRVIYSGNWDVIPREITIDFNKKEITAASPWELLSQEQDMEYAKITSKVATAFRNFVLLLNCKNIETVNNHPPKKLNEARRRKGKQELFTYKTLQIKTPGIKKVHGESQPTGEHNRIHFCRGHFKEYTEEHPLFGKVTGLWWWQPHVRGRNHDGIVLKDYKVKVNTDQEFRMAG